MTHPPSARKSLALGLALTLSALPAAAETPDGDYASGWPIALAEAACGGDEGCLTQLANCGPGATDCMSGVSLCTYSTNNREGYTGACRTDVIASDNGKAILATLPSGYSLTLFMPTQGTAALNGLLGQPLSDTCVTIPDENLTFCARPLITEADFDLWRQETGQ